MSLERALRPSARRALAMVMAVWILGLIATGIAPHDRATWFLEAAPVMIAMPLLLATREKFPFTTLAYVLICIHGLILMLGAMYTYAMVPAGDWVQEWLGLERNPYDRFGHFAQGFIPAIVAREILIRTFRLAPGGFLFFLVVCIALALSACYEMIEWWTALALGQGADHFLGTQGDEWDTQWDMFLALVGAVVSQGLFSRLHDREIRALRG
jgi:putative membrane protein